MAIIPVWAWTLFIGVVFGQDNFPFRFEIPWEGAGSGFAQHFISSTQLALKYLECMSGLMIDHQTGKVKRYNLHSTLRKFSSKRLWNLLSEWHIQDFSPRVDWLRTYFLALTLWNFPYKVLMTITFGKNQILNPSLPDFIANTFATIRGREEGGEKKEPRTVFTMHFRL